MEGVNMEQLPLGDDRKFHALWSRGGADDSSLAGSFYATCVRFKEVARDPKNRDLAIVECTGLWCGVAACQAKRMVRQNPRLNESEIRNMLSRQIDITPLEHLLRPENKSGEGFSKGK